MHEGEMNSNMEMSNVKKSRSILVVEDDKGLNRLIQRLLQREGFRTNSAFYGVEAVEKTMKNKNTTLLLDYMLPDMTGKQVIETLTSKECHVPFIVMTGNGDEKIAVEMMKMGAKDYIVKDTNLIDILPSVIGRVVSELVREDKLAAAELALQESEARLSSFMDSATDIFVLFDSEMNLIEINTAGLENWRVKRKDVIGKNLLEIFPNLKKNGRYDESLNVITTGVPLSFDDIATHPELGDQYHLIKLFKVGNGLGIIINDLTNRKLAEEQIKTALKEKDILLKEVHHRVKNNLQIISSLLKLQSKQIKNGDILETFKESQNRIKSMALIHEKLYSSKDFTHIDFNGYIRDLVSSLFQTYKTKQGRIKLNQNIENISLAVEVAIPCGLIITELVSNVLKYAFPDGREGEINITLCSSDDDNIKLIVGDNGIGIPGNFDINHSDSLGLHLVKLLAEDQLGGTIKLDRTRGTEFQIEFGGVR